jgi:hypothetical protein
MSTEEDLHKLKFTKTKNPRNLSLGITKITMKYKHVIPDSKTVAYMLRLRKFHYANTASKACTSKELIECMSGTWKLRRDTTEESKTVAGLALGNLTNLGKKGPHFSNYGKKIHKGSECTTEKKKAARIKTVTRHVVVERITATAAVVMDILRLNAPESLGVPITRNLRSLRVIKKLVQSRSLLLTMNIVLMEQMIW